MIARRGTDPGYRIDGIEKKIGAGLIEEVVQVAEGELELVDEMLQHQMYVSYIPFSTRLNLLTADADGMSWRRNLHPASGCILIAATEFSHAFGRMRNVVQQL